MPYDSSNCRECPYLDQNHLPLQLKTPRSESPVELEWNNSKTLIVGEAPGIEEWRMGAPFQPTKKVGGTAGARLARSWQRAGKKRKDFDLLNTVQCYPGQDGNRDARPTKAAVCACSGRLAAVLAKNNYERVICFGRAAEKVVSQIQIAHALNFSVVPCRHPSGGASNEQLDALW